MSAAKKKTARPVVKPAPPRVLAGIEATAPGRIANAPGIGVHDADTYDVATARFAEYAGMDAPRLPADQISAYQVALCRWNVEQLGLQSPERMVLGIIEEIGEFCAADTDAELADAIGDILIFATQLCTSARLDFGALWECRRELDGGENDLDTLTTIGNLSHVVLKTAQGIRGYDDPEKSRRGIAEALVELFSIVGAAAETIDVDAMATYKRTADKVMERKWRAKGIIK